MKLPLDPFEGSWYRFDRAATHRQAAIAKWSVFLAKEPYDGGVHVDDEGDGTVWIEQIDRPQPSIGVLLGEYFYNLRTALDYCVYDVAVHDSKENPPPRKDALQFPIYSNPGGWSANEYRIDPLSEEHRDWLKSVQPCFRQDGEPRWSPLHWLNNLAKLDRHRQLHVVGGYISESAPMVWVKPEAEVTFLDFERNKFVEDYAEVARFKVVPWTPEHHVEANPNSFLDMEIGEMARDRTPDIGWLYWPIRSRLFIIETYVDAIIGRFQHSCTGWTRSKFFKEGVNIDGPTG